MKNFLVMAAVLFFVGVGMGLILFSDSFFARLFALLVYSLIFGVIAIGTGIQWGERQVAKDAAKAKVDEMFERAKR